MFTSVIGWEYQSNVSVTITASLQRAKLMGQSDTE